MALFNNTTFRLLNQGLDAAWLRQQVASQNIANADTPNYKARTVEFSTILKEKCKCSYGKHFHENEKSELNLTTKVTVEDGTNQILDGNNVDVEKESMELVNAQIQFDALSGKIEKEFQMIRTAITR